MIPVTRFVLLIGVALCIGAPAYGQPDPAGPDPTTPDAHSPRLLSWAAIWENDGAFIKPFDESDRHYTNGLRFDIAFDQLLPKSWTDAIPGAGSFEDKSEATGLVLAQLIFTSEDIERKARKPDDRPYAGWLYGGLYYQRSDSSKLDHFELDIGVVGGDASAAESIQTFIHSVTPNQVSPQGWDDQLSNELGINFKYQRRWKYRDNPESLTRPQFDFDLIPEAGFMLGNVYTNLNGAITLRAGHNLPDDFGPPRVAQFRDATGSWSGRWGAYAFARAGGRLVAQDIFLDGNTFAESVSVDKEPAVGEVALGVAGRFKKCEFGWSFTWLTEEFDAQDHGDAFGAIWFTWRTEF